MGIWAHDLVGRQCASVRFDPPQRNTHGGECSSMPTVAQGCPVVRLPTKTAETDAINFCPCSARAISQCDVAPANEDGGHGNSPVGACSFGAAIALRWCAVHDERLFLGASLACSCSQASSSLLLELLQVLGGKKKFGCSAKTFNRVSHVAGLCARVHFCPRPLRMALELIKLKAFKVKRNKSPHKGRASEAKTESRVDREN